MRIGTGLQNKLLEAMSMKIPSITTSLANGALNAENGKHILIGDNAGELASSIIRLLTDERLSVKIAEAGYNFVHKNYSWKESTAKLEKLMMRESDKYNKFSDGE
jgi:glycosyltransferase involved in cell wall biosynthesis